MSKYLSHNDWVIQEFSERHLKPLYRNVILHASFIEGVVRSMSNKDSFFEANKSLKDAETISPEEFDAFEEVRKVRNDLIHGIFKDSLDEEQIVGLRDTLREKILTAYRISKFLDDNVFKRYGIERPSIITLDVP